MKKVFMVVASANAEIISDRIGIVFDKADFYKVSNDTFCIASEGDTNEVAKKVGIKGDRVGSGIVMLLGEYSGFHNQSLWTWLEQKL